MMDFFPDKCKNKVGKDKVETMGGVGGHPPKYSIIKVK